MKDVCDKCESITSLVTGCSHYPVYWQGHKCKKCTEFIVLYEVKTPVALHCRLNSKTFDKNSRCSQFKSEAGTCDS